MNLQGSAMIRFHFDIQQYHGLHGLALTFPSELRVGRLSGTWGFAGSLSLFGTALGTVI